MAVGAGAIALVSAFVSTPAGSFAVGLNAKNIVFAGGKNLGGTAGKFYWCFDTDILSWPAALSIDWSTITDYKDLVIVPLADPFVFNVGKCFNTVDCVLEEGEVTHTQIGPADTTGFENGYNNNYPGNDEDYLGWDALIGNRKIVILAEELNGKIRVIGFPNYPARKESSAGTSGKKVSDGRKNEASFKCRGPVPPPIYKAPIPITPAEA